MNLVNMLSRCRILDLDRFHTTNDIVIENHLLPLSTQSTGIKLVPVKTYANPVEECTGNNWWLIHEPGTWVLQCHRAKAAAVVNSVRTYRQGLVLYVRRNIRTLKKPWLNMVLPTESWLRSDFFLFVG